MTQTAAKTSIWLLALLGGIVAVIVNSLIALIAPSLIGQSMMIPNPSTNTLETLSLVAVIAASFIPAFVAAGFLLLLQRFTQNALQKFQIIAAVFACLSLFGPISLPISLGVKIALCLMHLGAAISIVGALSQTKKA